MSESCVQVAHKDVASAFLIVLVILVGLLDIEVGREEKN